MGSLAYVVHAVSEGPQRIKVGEKINSGPQVGKWAP